MKPNLSVILGATFLLGVAESVDAQAVPAAAAIAALRTHVGTSPQRPLVLVPDSSGDTILAQTVAKAIGAKSRSAADGRSCRGIYSAMWMAAAGR